MPFNLPQKSYLSHPIKSLWKKSKQSPGYSLSLHKGDAKMSASMMNGSVVTMEANLMVTIKLICVCRLNNINIYKAIDLKELACIMQKVCVISILHHNVPLVL